MNKASIRKDPRRCCTCETLVSGSKVKIDGYQRVFCPACWGKLLTVFKQLPSMPNMESTTGK